MLLLGPGNLCSSGEAAVDWVVKESSNIVDEERVKQLGDLFLVGEFEGTLERNPVDAHLSFTSLLRVFRT